MGSKDKEGGKALDAKSGGRMAVVSGSGQCQGRMMKNQMLIKYVANNKEKSMAAVFYSKSSTELPKVVKKVKVEQPAKKKDEWCGAFSM